MTRSAAKSGAGKTSMTYKLTIDAKPTYLHAIVTGQNSRENVERYVEDVIRECIARNCFRVLIEERLEGPRKETTDVFHLVSEGSDRVHRLLRAIAYVDVNGEGNLMKFAETVAVNRGVPLAVFSTVVEAENWLRGERRDGAEPSVSADVPPTAGH